MAGDTRGQRRADLTTEIPAESLTLEEAIANLQSPDPSLRYYAAWWVGRFRVDRPDVLAALVDLLRDEGDRTEEGSLPLQRNAARALAKIGDASCVEPLLVCLQSPDYYVREAAAQALGKIGDRRAIEPLLALLAGGPGAITQVPSKPHLTEPADSVIEALGNLAAAQAIAIIQPFTAHPLTKVSYAAVRAMYQLTQDPIWGDRLVAALQGGDLQLRRSVMGDLGAIGYLPAAAAIAQTPAENSLKLIALKGLVEHPNAGTSEPTGGDRLTTAAIEILQVMDQLL